MSLVKKHLWVVVESEEIRKRLVNRKLTLSFSGEAINPIYPTQQSPGYGSIKLGRMIHSPPKSETDSQKQTNINGAINLKETNPRKERAFLIYWKRHSIMIIPVRCFTCGKVIGNKWETYLSLLQADYSEG